MALTKNSLYYQYYKDRLLSVVTNPRLIPFYLGRLRQYAASDSFDIVIVSYPKSGRTWLQNILVELGKLSFDPQNEINEQTSISDALSKLGKSDNGFPAILATHAKSSWEPVEPIHDEQQIQQDDFSDFANQKIIFLHRDPRDVLVSQYYHIKLRNNIKDIDKEDLISNNVVGIKKIIYFMNKWLNYSEAHPEEIFRMSYEEMKKSPLDTLKNMCIFMGMNIDEDTISQAIKASDIKKMQKKQASSTNKDPWTTTKTPKNTNSFQSRKGKVGEHKEFFSPEQLQRINDSINELLDKKYGY